MNTPIRWCGGASTAILCLGFLLPGQCEAAKDGLNLPKDVYPKLVDSAIRDIQNALHELTGNILSQQQHENAIQKVRCAAVMLAMYARNGPSTIAVVKRAHLSDVALSLAKTIENGKYAEAKKLADAIQAGKLDPKVILQGFKGSSLSIEEVMLQFGSAKVRNQGIVWYLFALEGASVQHSAVPAEEINDQLLLTAYQAAVAAELTNLFRVNANPAGNQKWQKFAEENAQAAQELAVAVQVRQGNSAWIALRKLRDSCTKCHVWVAENKFWPGIAIPPLELEAVRKETRSTVAARNLVIQELDRLNGKTRSEIWALIDILKEKNPSYHQKVIATLQKAGLKPGSRLPIVHEILKDADDYVMYWFAQQMSQAGNIPSSILLLAQVLRHPDESLRRQAAVILGRLGKDADPAVAALQECLQDEKLAVYQAVVLALCKINTNTARQAIIQSLRVDDPMIRGRVSVALGRVGPLAVPALREALKSSDRNVQCSTMYALGRIGPEAKPAVPALLEMLQDKDEYYRFAAGHALKKIDPDAAVKAGVR